MRSDGTPMPGVGHRLALVLPEDVWKGSIRPGPASPRRNTPARFQNHGVETHTIGNRAERAVHGAGIKKLPAVIEQDAHETLDATSTRLRRRAEPHENKVVDVILRR